MKITTVTTPRDVPTRPLATSTRPTRATTPRSTGAKARTSQPPASTGASVRAASASSPLPADDPAIFELDLAGLRRHWADAARRSPIGAQAMTGADLRAQAMGVSGQRLMEQAGAAVAASAKALAEATGRWGKGSVLVLCGPGNNGGDGFVAARYLARQGAEVAVVLVASAARPTAPDAARNWDRLEAEPRIKRLHAGSARDLLVLGQTADRASLVIDALLGTGVQGALRDPIRTAVEVVNRVRETGVPVLAVDTPTAMDLSSGDPSDPVVRADLTVTFHRPKTGLQSRRGAAYAGKVLVAPIGIPLEADRG